MHFIYISCNLKNYTHSLIVRSAEIIALVGYVVDFADVVIYVFFVICFCACLLVVCYNMIIIVCGEGILSNLVRNNVSNKTTSIIELHRAINNNDDGVQDVKHKFPWYHRQQQLSTMS